MIRQSVLTISKNRETPRIWIQGKYLEKAGFMKGTPIKITFTDNTIEIIPYEQGERKVSGTNNRAPIIDINNRKILESLPGVTSAYIRILKGLIRITKTEWDKRKDEPSLFTSVDIFSGGGLLTQAAKEAGFMPRYAIEYNEKFADIWQRNHNGQMFNMHVADVPLEELNHVDLALAGIPCESFSIARQNGIHYNVHSKAHLAMFVIPIIMKTRPKFIVFEEVPKFLDTEIAQFLFAALNDLHYTIHHRTISGDAYGEPTVRKRAVIIASLYGYDFPELSSTGLTLQDVLLPVDDPKLEWWNRETKSWVFDHWENQKAKGNNFGSQILEYDSSITCQAITKRYFAQQAGNPVVKHPTLPDTYRWLTLDEVKMIMGVPNDYDLGESKTIAGEVLGQGVLVRLFKNIIRGIVNGK